MIVILMGVTGAGKTTVGRLLAQQLGWEFADADDFHPPANVEKIRNGIALNDADRQPWLRLLKAEMDTRAKAGRKTVLACSALKHSYRQELRAPGVRFVYLKGSPALIAGRLRTRQGHFAGEEILAAQFADLEEPDDAIVVHITQSPDEIVMQIRQALGLG